MELRCREGGVIRSEESLLKNCKVLTWASVTAQFLKVYKAFFTNIARHCCKTSLTPEFRWTESLLLVPGLGTIRLIEDAFTAKTETSHYSTQSNVYLLYFQNSKSSKLVPKKKCLRFYLILLWDFFNFYLMYSIKRYFFPFYYLILSRIFNLTSTFKVSKKLKMSHHNNLHFPLK